jgi:hypothetical protein
MCSSISVWMLTQIYLYAYYYIPFLNDQSKTLQIKLTSEIGFHIKYVSVIIVFIQLHVYNSYLLLFDLERSNDLYKVALDWQ